MWILMVLLVSLDAAFQQFFNSLDAGLWWEHRSWRNQLSVRHVRYIEKLASAWKPKSQASNASLDEFIRDVNFSID
ncbi:unnamed protein product [Rhizophagus irregularis]|nr:unnamed protein product [Rhizophagus irregularis]